VNMVIPTRDEEDALAAALRGLSTPTLSDALDALDIEGALQGLSRLVEDPAVPLVAGPAFPVQFEAAAAGSGAPAADYLDDAPPGCVVVLANAGRLDCTVWGGLLAFRARQLGLRGTVIDGCCRDVEEVRGLGYAVFARGCFMRSGKRRARMASAGQPVTIGHVVIQPEDVVCGDGSGALVIPRPCLHEVLREARRIQQVEAQILADLRAGCRLDEARRRHGYNR
jgi:regulator of RNase E activity RraA